MLYNYSLETHVKISIISLNLCTLMIASNKLLEPNPANTMVLHNALALQDIKLCFLFVRLNTNIPLRQQEFHFPRAFISSQ